jgi:hypothetical protein
MEKGFYFSLIKTLNQELDMKENSKKGSSMDLELFIIKMTVNT